MVTNNNIADYIMNLISPSGENKKLQNANKMDFPQFKDILSTTSGKMQTGNRDKLTGSESVKLDSRKDNFFAQNKPVRTYRDIVANNKALDNDSQPEEKQVEEHIDDSRELSKVRKTDRRSSARSNALMESLAQLLGLNPNELMKLLSALNIKPEDLADASKADEAVDKLAGLLGLSKDDAQALKTVVTGANQAADSLKETLSLDLANHKGTEDIQNSQESGKKDWVKLDNAAIKVENSANLDEIIAKFRAGLHTLSVKVQNNPQEVLDEVSSKLQEIAAQGQKSEVQQTETPQVKDEKITNPQQAVVNKVDENSQNGSSQNNHPSGSGKELSKGLEETGVNDNLKAAKAEGDVKDSQFNTVLTNQVQKTEALSAVKVQRDVPVTKSEIINQVIDKAKVFVGSEKSEMIMDLNPESLGKLSLKIVTERGMVAAKFVAENQQVKETLEANMQLLKDSLQKQGLVVQDCSVSVGQESFKGFQRNNGTAVSADPTSRKSGSSGEGMVNVVEMSQKTASQNNPYEWNESSINLTV